MAETRDTNWPAFPVSGDDEYSGMDVRDYFAAKAMAAIIQATFVDLARCAAIQEEESCSVAYYTARLAYEYANEMLLFREQ